MRANGGSMRAASEMLSRDVFRSSQCPFSAGKNGMRAKNCLCHFRTSAICHELGGMLTKTQPYLNDENCPKGKYQRPQRGQSSRYEALGLLASIVLLNTLICLFSALFLANLFLSR